MALLSRWEPWGGIEHQIEPFQEIDALQRHMNRLFDRLMPHNGGREAEWNFIPTAELEATEDAFHLKLEVPGLDPKDIDVEVTPDSVSISGERKSETQTQRAGYIRSEFQYGRFHRTIPLPSQVQNDNVQAEYKDGILRLTLPKSEAGKQKSVKVNLR